MLKNFAITQPTVSHHIKFD
ncbi:hypothetical protein GWK51_00195 [Acinetobacter sp. PS-1]|nr:hypothetical protein [Acinetobacter kanungonis]